MTSRSRNSHIRSPRSVTFAPIGMPSRSLNPAIDLRALVTTGFWPVMTVEVGERGLKHTTVLDGVTHAHVDDDLLEPRHLHDVLQAELAP